MNTRMNLSHAHGLLRKGTISSLWRALAGLRSLVTSWKSAKNGCPEPTELGIKPKSMTCQILYRRAARDSAAAIHPKPSFTVVKSSVCSPDITDR